MKGYFIGNRFKSEKDIYSEIDKLENNNYFNNYNIIHFGGCFGTSDTIEINMKYEENKLIFNFDIITHTNDGIAQEGLKVQSYLYIIDKEFCNKYENIDYFIFLKMINTKK